MEPLIILHVIDSLSTGGAEHQLASHLQHADRTRFRHLVCALSGGVRFTEMLQASGVTVFSLELKRRRDMLRGVRRLWRLVREQRPAVIHATLFRAAVISRTVGQLSGVPVVTSLVSPTYEPEWSADNPKLQGPRVRLAHLIDRLTARAWGTQFVAITQAVKDSAVRQLGVSPDRIEVIPRGLAFDRMRQPSDAELAEARAFLGGPSRYPVILTVGRLVPPKGQRYAILAMKQVAEAFPHARLVIIGGGRLRAPLEDLIRTQGLGDRVMLAGEHLDVDVLLHAADLFVFPSLSEGFGVALLEALGAGRACVVSRIPALAEVTNGGRVALLVEPGSPEALAAGMIRLTADRGLAARLGSEAAAWARARYDIARSMQRLEDLYSTLVAHRPTVAGEAEFGSR
jgi:glycosyltransferase involved in cell wall biosynthesis